jgi:lipoyl synthase
MACIEPSDKLLAPRKPAPVPAELRNGNAVKRDAISPSGLYRPQYRKTPAMRSPDYVQLSTAAAITLGLIPGKIYRCGCTRCLNLLLTYPEGCRANCAYCGLARHREAATNYADRNFIRVDWPAAPLDEIVARVADRGETNPFHRMCISMITHPRSDSDTPVVLERWIRRIPRERVPVSILSNPTTMTRADVMRLYEIGADIFTVALDACTPEIFERTRGKGVDSPHRWQTYWAIFDHARDIFGPERIGMHLIVGLGETDRDVLDLCRKLRAVGGHSHLFCFYPERGSLMDHLPAPPRSRWRRLQLARYLLEYRDVPFEALAFSAQGALLSFGLNDEELEPLVRTGIPFRTSGCPGKDRADVSACDRPYGDSPPSDIASYPFAPNGNDVRRIRRQLREGAQ